MKSLLPLFAPVAARRTHRTRRRRAAVAATLAAAIGAVVALCMAPGSAPDPAIDGRSARSWTRDLSDPDYAVREAARRALGRLGSPATPRLIEALQTRDVPFARRVETWQQRWGVRLVRSTDRSPLREQAAALLAEPWAASPQALRALALALRDPSPAVVREAQGALRRHGVEAVPVLVEFLSHTDQRLRLAVARVLTDLGPAAAAAKPALRAGMEDRAAAVRRQCVLALGATGWGFDSDAAVLRGACADPAAEVRMACAEVMGSRAEELARFEPLLRGALGDPVPAVRVSAAKALLALGAPPAPVVAVLAGALTDRDAGWRAAFVLGDIGVPAAAAIPQLVEALLREQGPRPLREAPSSAFALGRMGEAAVQPLANLLDHPAARVRTSAAIALGFVGPAAREAAPRLMRLMRDPDAEARQAAALSLATVSPGADGLAAALAAMTREDDIHVANAAATALQKIDPLAAANLPAQ